MRTRILWIVLFITLMCCTSSPPEEKIDHIIIAINDLQKGIAQFRELTGVEPVFGGIHPNSYTQNALVALDNQAYIEILAPRTDLDSIPDFIKQFDSLTPVGWAVTSADLEKTRSKVADMDFNVSDVRSGSRAKPDGATLSWSTFGVNDKDTMIYPFFIQWGEGTVHPSVSSPAGCEFVSFKISTSDDQPLTRLTTGLKLNATVEKGSQNTMVLELKTPNGRVVFPVR